MTQFHSYTERIFYKIVDCSTISAIVGSVSLCFEPIGRQAEIALFSLNKSMEVLYNFMRRRSYPIRIPYGECWLNAAALAIITYIYMNDCSIFREHYRKLIGKLLDDI